MKYIHIHVRINELTRGPDCICIMYICKYTGALMLSSLTSSSTEQEASRTQTLQYYTILYRTNRSHDMT